MSTPIEIANLLDGENIRSVNDVIAFQQGSTTFKGSVRPYPPRQIIALNQAQLEAELGTDLEIPDSTALTIVIDDSFALTKPFKIGLDTTLELRGSTVNTTLTYTGPGGLFQNTNPANDINTLNLSDIIIVGIGTNSVFDIIASTTIFVKDSIFLIFDSVGTLDCPVNIFDTCSFQGFTKGLIFKNSSNVSITTVSVVQFAPTGLTAFTIQAGVGIPVNVDMDIVVGASFFAGDSLVFFDPNSVAGSLYTIEKSFVVAGDLYQQGTDIAIDSVADNGSGDARFTTATPHGLVVGKPVVISDFITNTDYNGTLIVTAIPTTTTFDVDILFGTDEAVGKMNAASLDQESPLVRARDNTFSPDSQSQAEARTGATLEVDGAAGGDFPIVDITPAPGDWIEDPNTEEFSIDTSTGLITYNGTKDRTFLIEYQLTAVPTSGGAQVINFDLHVNGVQQTKSIIQIDTSVANVGAYIGGLFVLTPGDTLQLFKNNTTNTNNTDISVSTVLATL